MPAGLELVLTPGLGPVLFGRLLERFGTVEAVSQAGPLGWHEVKGISSSGAERLWSGLQRVRGDGLAEREVERAAAGGVRVIGLEDPGYPALLRHIHDPPPVLWIRGSLEPDDALAVGVVGSRKCSHYGREQAGRLGSDCARAGLTIMSGGAYGIDTAAHSGAMRAGGRTVAVIGSGLNKPYPEPNRGLFDQMVNSGQGVMVSELPMDTPPAAEHFPRRNRIISGMSLGVIVVEAAVRSGALITARLCAEDHGRELMVVPGRVDSATSAGCHKVLREGWGSLVTSASDVLDQLGEAGRLLDAQTTASNASSAQSADAVWKQAASASQQALLTLMDQPRTLDELVAVSGMAVSAVRTELTLMEVSGTVKRQGGLFARRRVDG